jgi:MFS family permease
VEDKNRYRFVIQSIISLVRICSGMIWASAGPLLPLIMGAYGLNRGGAGWFASIAPLTITLLAVPIGITGTRYSLKKTFAVGAFFQAAGILAPFCSSYILILLTRMSFAIGTAITFPLITAIAAEWFTARELPLINGITMSFNSLGNAIAFVATVPIATVLSWRAPMIIYGAVALTCATAWLIFGRDRRKERTYRGAIKAEVARTKSDLTIRQALTQRSTVLLSLATLGCWCLGNSVGSWLPTYYHQVFNMPLERASSITAVVTVAGIVSCLAGGILALRIGRRRPFLIVPGIFSGLSVLCAVLFNNTVVIYISLAFFGIFANSLGPSLFSIPFELPNISPRTGAIVIFAMLFAGNFGNFIGPLFVGYLADLTGSFLPGFIISAVISLALLVAGLMLPETGPQARKVQVII